MRSSAERINSLLTRGAVNINQGDPTGRTPLMCAARQGCPRIVGILLNKGANMSIVCDMGFTALLISAQNGHVAVTTTLLKAGADLEQADKQGFRVLHMASSNGHSEVMKILMNAGANVDCRGSGGETPLYLAASKGHVGAMRLLLDAKANPLLTAVGGESATQLPLDIAATNGQSDAVHQLIHQLGIEVCGGESGGVHALQAAAQEQHLGIMATLALAGVVDTGGALISAAGFGGAESVKFLLEQQGYSTLRAAYANHRDPLGRTPLGACILGSDRSCSPRVVRLLVDAGADTTTRFRLVNTRGKVVINEMPLVVTKFILIEKNVRGRPATEKQLRRVEATRRLLLQVEAVHAVSWRWPGSVSSVVHPVESARRMKTTSTSRKMMLPIVKRQGGAHRVISFPKIGPTSKY